LEYSSEGGWGGQVHCSGSVESLAMEKEVEKKRKQI
jgi:hypothetical protein